MGVYCVQISASGIRGKFGDEYLVCGFIKNEYILAGNKERARLKAIVNVERKLLKKDNLNTDDVNNVELTVDSIETGFSWLSVFREDGFVFHSVES